MSLELTRREMILGTAATVLTVSNVFSSDLPAKQAATAKGYKHAFEKLDEFIDQYLKEMNAPGMTLAIADRGGLLRTSVYGVSDLEQRLPVRSDHLFQIGSITKSFAALVCLQLVDEGKLDVHKSILEYLPWFPLQSADTITVHHLLTHSSGMPGNPPLFMPDPSARHESGFSPGEAFHYCNMGYVLLGHLIQSLDKVSWNESVRKRIFVPLQMIQTEARIGPSDRARMAKNYSPFLDDRPYTRMGKLAPAASIAFTDASGCIASTPADMAKYMTMILNGGVGPEGRILSEASFTEFSKAQIKAEDFGPTASYGYGIAVDTMDGHKILRHTGGMVSFMSAMHVDLDEGIGLFASINAQQGYRPNPVCAYGLKLLRAANAQQPLPPVPDKNPPESIADAADYAGSYVSEDGSKLEFAADAADRLSLIFNGRKFPVENSSGGLIVRHPDFEIFAFDFRRDGEKGHYTSVGHGNRFYVGSGYSGARQFEFPREWNAYTGYYRNESPWVLGFRIVIRQGKLWIDGTEPLESTNNGRFRLTTEPKSPEWISFHDIVNGNAMRVNFSGETLWRVPIEEVSS